jgi:hypothetical protein
VGTARIRALDETRGNTSLRNVGIFSMSLNALAGEEEAHAC